MPSLESLSMVVLKDEQFLYPMYNVHCVAILGHIAKLILRVLGRICSASKMKTLSAMLASLNWMASFGVSFESITPCRSGLNLQGVIFSKCLYNCWHAVKLYYFIWKWYFLVRLPFFIWSKAEYIFMIFKLLYIAS